MGTLQTITLSLEVQKKAVDIHVLQKHRNSPHMNKTHQGQELIWLLKVRNGFNN